MKVNQIIEQMKNNSKNMNKHFSIYVKLEYFKNDLYGDSCQLRFIIYDGTMNFTGRTLEEAFQNLQEFDNDFGRHFDMETKIEGFKVEDKELFLETFDQSCENLINAKTVKQQIKLAV